MFISSSRYMLFQFHLLYMMLGILFTCFACEDSSMTFKSEMQDQGSGDETPLNMTDMGDLNNDMHTAGMSAGGEAGSMSGTMAGETAGSMGGMQAGELAGEVAGEQAGELAGEFAGENAGELAGEMMVTGDWPLRNSCDLVIHAHINTADQVRLAAPFTQWGEQALMMTAQGDEGFMLTLNPYQGVGQQMGLQEGQRYPYKFIVDNTWQLDADNRLRQYEGECINSAFEMPRCSQPALQIHNMTYDVNGDLYVEVDVLLASVIQDNTIDTMAESSLPDSFDIRLDGQSITPEIRVSEGKLIIEQTGLSQGKHRLTLSFTDQLGRVSPEIVIPFWIERERFDWRDTVLYMFMVDRFANGTTTNDFPVEDSNVPYSINWHGGDLQGALQVLESGYFEELGVKAIWLSPVNEQVNGTFEDRNGVGRQFASYHGYWPIKARDVDVRYGGNEGLRAFVQAAHARGIRVLLDLINNQVHQQHEYYQAHPEWFRTGCVCGIDPGCGWSERPLDCLFASYLPDINWRIAGAEEQFIADAIYWIDEFDVDGFRVDAVKHVETTSIYNLRYALQERFGEGERIWMLGETAVGAFDSYPGECDPGYSSGYEWIDAYTAPQALDGQFDFPTSHRVRGPILQNGSWQEIDQALQDMNTFYKPQASHVRFFGSHDSPRVASQAAGDPALGCSFADATDCTSTPQEITQNNHLNTLKRAWTLLWTTPGTPLLYYGDEIAMPGANDPDNRRDMRWQGELADVNISAATVGTLQNELYEWFKQLAHVRNQHMALRRGAFQVLWVDQGNNRDIYWYARVSDQADQAVIFMALNQGDAVTRSRIWDGLSEPLIQKLSQALANTEMTEIRYQASVGEGEFILTEDTLTINIPAQQSAIFVIEP